MAKQQLEDRAKAKNVGPLRQLMPFLKPYAKLMWGALGALILTAGLSLSFPLVVRGVIDGFSKDNLAEIDQVFIYAILIAGALAIGTALRFYLVTRLGERVIADIRQAVYTKVIGMSPVFYEKIMTGEVLSRLTTDTTLILSVISSSISVALRNVLMFIGGLGFMLFTSAYLTGLVLLTVPLIIVPIVVFGRRLRNLSRESQDRIADSSGMASETLLAAQTVQAYTHETQSRDKYDALVEAGFETAKKRIITRSIMTASIIFLVFTGIVTVLWMGTGVVQRGEMGAGQLVQFVIYSVMVAGAVGALSEIWGELQRAAGATERLVELINAEDPIVDPTAPADLQAPISGEINFKNVTFHYPARPKVAALSGFNLHIKAGETVALVGPSGAGKSTIFQLLMRFYEPTEGEIMLEGHALADLSLEDMRSQMALVPQDPVIFATSAMENIRFGRPEATDTEVIEAAKAAAAHEFLSKLPEGYDSYVGERGVMLSGGQKQRIAIARAILRDAPVLLLDEATSALDAESERAVQKAVEAMAVERTTLIIAHRLATVKKADRIVVFDEGKVVAEGTHDELVAANGLYARLAKLQFTEGQLG
ncbi:MAG: ATP-binding cassette domain-containing protein [Rhodobacteraceae bacterium]|nr:ATP-binding cassette domain-containing protein [Paracoccaceae bacterium]